MKELLTPLETEYQQLVDEEPVLGKLSDDINTQADKLDELENAAEAVLKDLKRLIA